MSSRSSGYPTKLFVEPPSDDFICGLCLDVLNNPHQCRNGHCFCYGCICSALAVQKVCPLCKCSMNVESMNSNLLVRNLIDKSYVKCENVGCDWTGTLHRFESHFVNDCDYRLLICTNEGCSARLPRKLLDTHVREECPFRKVVCEFCSKSFKSEECSDHLGSCELRPIVCRCLATVLNENLSSHLRDECPLEPCPCPLFYMNCCKADCPKQIIRSQINEHISHVTQNPEYINQLTHSLLRTVNKCEQLTQQQAQLETKLGDLSTIVQSLQEQIKGKADRLCVNVRCTLNHGVYVGEMKNSQRHGYGTLFAILLNFLSFALLDRSYDVHQSFQLWILLRGRVVGGRYPRHWHLLQQRWQAVHWCLGHGHTEWHPLLQPGVVSVLKC